MTPQELSIINQAIGLLESLLAEPKIRNPDLLAYDELSKQFDWVSGAYRDYKCEDVFPITSGAYDLLHFDKRLSSQEVIAEGEKQNLRPATFIELLDFAKNNPDEQRKYWIVGLGSRLTFAMGGGVVCVPVLDGDAGGRGLDYGEFDYGWDAGLRFLFVRK